jgi:hypothetical protein
MIWFPLFVLAANLSTLIANPFPLAEDSVSLSRPDLETQLGFSTAFPADESVFDLTYSPPDAGSQGKDSDLFDVPPVLVTSDNTAGQSLAFPDLDNSVLASDGSSCGSQGSSGDRPTDSELALDSFSLDSLEARGFLDDVEKLNEITDPPTGGLCATPNSQARPEQQKGPRPYRKTSDDSRLGPEPWKADSPIQLKEFGQCPALRPEYSEALCCTGEHYGIYVLTCARGTISAALFPPSLSCRPSALAPP